MRESDPGRIKAMLSGTPGRAEGGKRRGDRESSVVLGVSYCLTPLHSLGSRREKAACLFKGTGDGCQGREWRREGGGGSERSKRAQ